MIEKKYRTKKVQSREYQLELVSKINCYYPNKNILLLLPYGTGKTIIFLLWIKNLIEEGVLKEDNLVVFTSEGPGAKDRCRQALAIAKTFGFHDSIGYLLDPRSLPRNMRRNGYLSARIIFLSVNSLQKDLEYKKIFTTVKRRLKIIVIDEIGEICAKSLEGIRLRKNFNLLRLFPSVFFLGMTAIEDARRLAFLENTFKFNVITHDVASFQYSQYLIGVFDSFIETIDRSLNSLIIRSLLDINTITQTQVSPGRAVELAYLGITERLEEEKDYMGLTSNTIVKNKFSQILRASVIKSMILNDTPFSALRSILNKNFREIQNELDADENHGNNISNQFKEIKGYSIKSTDKEETIKALKNSWKRTTKNKEFFLEEFMLMEYQKCNVQSIQDVLIQRIKRSPLSVKTWAAIEISKILFKGNINFIVFCRYVQLAKQVNRQLVNAGIFPTGLILGATPPSRREHLLEAFKRNEIVALILTKVGGKGLDLITADAVIQLDLLANADEMKQRKERIRGGLEFIVFIDGTSENKKIKNLYPKTEIILHSNLNTRVNEIMLKSIKPLN